MLPFEIATPFPPDGTIALGDRQHIALSYSGIDAGAPAAAPTETGDSFLEEQQIARHFFPKSNSAVGRSSFGFSLPVLTWLRQPHYAGA